MIDVATLTAGTLRQVEAALKRRVALSELNAMLALADPALVLPLPAVASVAIETASTWRPEPRTALRSIDPLLPSGEALFTIAEPRFTAQPWRVTLCSWIDHPQRKCLADGIRVELSRPPGSRCEDGWLTLHLAGSPLLRSCLAGLRAYAGASRLDVSIGGSRLDVRAPSIVLQRLAALGDDIVWIRVGRELSVAHDVTLELRFDEPLVLLPSDGVPRVATNVVPVWNSLDAVYPGPFDAAQAIAETRSQIVHPLAGSQTGPEWSPWNVVRVAAACDGRMDLVLGVGAETAGSPTFRLAYVPSHEDRSTLSVVLSPEARAWFDDHGERVRVDYRVTTGALSNGIPDGAEFTAVPLDGMPMRSRVTARTLGCTWGGSDGALRGFLDQDPADRLRALLPPTGPRAVADVVNVLELVAGGELELVDARDLLRRGGQRHGPLFVRVRFRDGTRSDEEKRAMLTACDAMLGEFLGRHDAGGLQLVEVSDESPRAAW